MIRLLPACVVALTSRTTRFALLGVLATFALVAAPAFAQQADLVVNQADSPDPGPAGGVFTYTIRVDNNGPNAAIGINFSDTLPAGSTFVSATTTQGSCGAPVAGVVSCAMGDLAFLANATVTLKIILPAAGVGTNTASATSSTPDPNTSNNLNITEDTTAQNASDMTLVVVDSPDPVAAGASYSYAVTAVNNGPTAAASQTIAFTIPAGACVRSIPTGTGWACVPAAGYPLCSGTITCTRSVALGSGASAPTLTVPAVANVGGSITAAFQVSSPLADGNPANNTVTATTNVSGGSSDVSITKTASLATVAVGSNVTYTLTPRLNGGVPAGTGGGLITVTDNLPAGLTLTATPTGSGWTCNSVPAAPTPGPATITCTRPGPFGANFTNMPVITIIATVTAVGPIANTATISAPESDPVPGNNSSTIGITGSNAADLRLVKTASINPVVPGQNFTYTLTANNIGPAGIAAGQTITVTDTLPAGISLRAAVTGTGWTCTTAPVTPPFPAAGPVTITCTRPGPLASGVTLPSITVPAVATLGGSLINNACVALTGTGPSDSVAGNNCSAVTVISTPAAFAADLQVISKTASPSPVNAGQDLTYVITVTNNGPADATNAIVTDALTSLVGAGGFQSATASQGTCTPNAVTAGPNVTVSCNLGTLLNGATATVTIVARPSIATTGNRSNTTSIASSDVGDPNRNNNSASVTSVVTAVADVIISKTDTPDPVQAGTPLTYVLTPRNNGPSTALTVVVTDTLPANAAFLSLSATTGSPVCSTPPVNSVGGTLTCTWASIASGVQQTATVIVRPLTGALTVHNDVTVSTTTVESNTGNNSAFADTAVTSAMVDILVNKVDSVDPVALGSLTKYTITVNNAGPSFATNVVLTDTFPVGAPTATFSYQGNLTISPAGIGSCVEPAINATSGTLTCTFPGLANTQSAIVTYDMRAESITSGVSGTTFNGASVTAAETETLPANNSTVHATTSRRPADLGIVKSAPAATVPGAALAWTLTVTNNGPNPSTGALVSDALPAGVTFVSASPGCVLSAGTVTCTLGTLAVGANTALTINVTVSEPYTGANPLANTATVATVNEIDNVSGNNSSTATTTVTAQADLAVAKSVSNGTPTVGSNVTFTITVTNNGPNTAAAAQVSDTLPAGYVFVSAVPSVGSYNSGTGVWTIGSLANGGSATLAIVATVQPGGPYLNTANVTSTTTDPVPGNNTASIGTTPVAQADLQVTKVVSNATPNVGTSVTFTVTVTNLGLSASANVQVTDALPAGYVFVSSAPSIGAYNAGTGLWNGIGTLAAGASATLAITASVQASGSYLNTATGTTTTGDPNPANNSASAGTTPVAVASLAITKTDNSTTYTPGGTGTYVVVVTNAGPSAASAVSVADTLPAGVTLSGTVTCASAGIAACGTVSGSSGQSSFGATGAVTGAGGGNSLTFTVPVAYASSMTTDPLVNTATATDPASPDATGSDSSRRQATVALVVAKTDGSLSYTPGGTATYVVTVTNTGPTDAANLTVTDALPAGLVLTANVTCTATGVAACGAVSGTTGQTTLGTTGATLGAAAGDSLVFSVSVSFAPGMTTAPLVNTATATDLATGATANGSDADTLAPQVSLAVAKTDGSSSYTPGGTASYTITITNGGLSTANAVTVTDTLPAGVVLTGTVTCVASGTSSCGTVTGVAGQTALGTTGAIVVPGAANSLVFTVPVAFAAGLATDPLLNTATATDIATGATGSGSDSDARAARVSLALTKTDNSATYVPGGTGTYIVTVRNTGASDALNVTVGDLLPTGVALTGTVSCTANGIATCGTVTGAAGQSAFGATSAGLGTAAGDSLVFTVPVAFAANLADDPLINTVTASDLASGATGSATDSDSRVAQPALAVTKTDGSPNYAPGGTAVYIITVRNTGVSDALNLTVSDALPPGVTLNGTVTCAVQGNANCGAVSGVLGQTSLGATGARIDAGPLNGLTFTVPVLFAANLTTDPLVNTVTATDVSSGATASATDSDVRVLVGATLAKTIQPSTIAAGGTATLTITLGNPNAASLTLAQPFGDTMPAGVTILTPNAGTCSGVTVAASLLNMAARSTIPAGGCTIVVTITSSTPGTVTNITGTLQTEAGTTPSASAPLTVTATGSTPPTLAKSIAPATIAPGGAATLTLTLGNANATALVLTAAFIDTMPAGVTTTSGNTGSCAGVAVAATQVTMATGSSIPPGGCTIIVGVTSSTPGTVTNTTGTLQTGGGNAPPAAAPITVATPGPGATADLAITKTNNATSVTAGSVVTYAIVVTNLGPNAVTGATVTDLVPAALTGVTWTCTASPGSSCPAAGAGNINATVNLLVNGTATFSLSGTLSAAATGTLVNTATVTPPPGTADPVPGNNAGTDSDPIIPLAPVVVDLAITKVHLGTFTPGQIGAQYLITVSNVGAQPSTGVVTVTETVPAGIAATAIAGAGWTCGQPAGPCTRSDSLAPGASYPALTLTVNIAANPPSPLINVVGVAGGGDTIGANNQANDQVTFAVVPPAGAEPIPVNGNGALLLLAALLSVMAAGQLRRRR